MIDTITLELNSEQYKLLSDNKLDGLRGRQVKGKFSSLSAYCKDYDDKQKKAGIYFPSIEMPKTKRGSMDLEVEKLLIQVSLPKLLYGTSIYDLSQYDEERIYSVLWKILSDVGIMTSATQLKSAIVKRVDFAKIIRLPDHFGQADEVIWRLVKFNYKQRSDHNLYQDYHNGRKGLYIKFWNTTQGFVIYDKLSEVLNNGYTKQEAKIEKLLNNKTLRRNLVKFEVSLERKQSMEALLRRFIKDKKSDFTLSDILKEKIVQSILLEVFDDVFNNIAVGLVSLSEMQDNRLTAYLEQSNLSLHQQESLYFWVNNTIKNGVAGAWSMLRQKTSGGSFDRRKKDIALILQELGKINENTTNLVDFLRAELINFEIIRPKQSDVIVNHC